MKPSLPIFSKKQKFLQTKNNPEGEQTKNTLETTSTQHPVNFLLTRSKNVIHPNTADKRPKNGSKTLYTTLYTNSSKTQGKCGVEEFLS
jgi:hypothetical protein